MPVYILLEHETIMQTEIKCQKVPFYKSIEFGMTFK